MIYVQKHHAHDKGTARRGWLCRRELAWALRCRLAGAGAHRHRMLWRPERRQFDSWLSRTAGGDLVRRSSYKRVATPFGLPLALGGNHETKFSNSASRRRRYRPLRRSMTAGRFQYHPGRLAGRLYRMDCQDRRCVCCPQSAELPRQNMGLSNSFIFH